MTGDGEGRSAGRTIAARQLVALLPDLSETRPAYRHLAQAVRALVLDGRIALHVKLPAERELASALGVSRVTVTSAYDLLREHGFATSRRGSGTWTALPDGRPPQGVSRLVGAGAETIDLVTAAPGMDHALLSAALRASEPELARHAHSSGYLPFGLPELRSAIADRYARRGLPTRPEQILVTSGAQQSLVLTLALLCAPGNRVLLENPSYPNAVDAVRQARLRTAAVPVTERGWDGDLLHATLRHAAPRLAYLIPDFHNPTGVLMPQEQRDRLLRAARLSGTWLVIDETLTEVALDVPVPAPLAAHANPGEADHVITIGSMSKSHWGGLRIGWVRATPRLVTELAALRVTADMSGSVLNQLIAHALLEDATGGGSSTAPAGAAAGTVADAPLAARIDRVRVQRAALTSALAQHIPQWTTQVPPGGLSLWVDLGAPIATALSTRALDHGVRIESGTRFGADPGMFEHRLRIPYTLPPAALDEAVRRLATALDSGLPLTRSTDTPHWVA
ncbi:MocR-like transcription factor YczR [Streptacidiphilus fuscans]|uniref:PLP-dependent aminotransferase family protein n=1 Tax=Streptacidiphilus fuscans TaxID=2789292 RepID=A0A931B1R4_9ACTN|nr:PLP-dependent aminotransferase family protein [Streptacidiphilus fuscans]MBF9067122.1 PLP-dependent aminotransferase family protein [Streptacidiphilus fuscans]